MNPLDEVMEWYNFNINQQNFFMEILKNSHKMQDNRVFNAILMNYDLSLLEKEERKNKMSNLKKELDDLTIVSLWAVFEAFLNDSIKQKTDKITKEITDPISNKIAIYAFKEADRWIKNNVLDFFKTKNTEENENSNINFDSFIVGDVKDIYTYRNWVAHGKSGEKPAVKNLIPSIVYKRLTNFLQESKLIENILEK